MTEETAYYRSQDKVQYIYMTISRLPYCIVSEHMAYSSQDKLLYNKFQMALSHCDKVLRISKGLQLGPHGYHHNGFMVTPALGTQGVRFTG